MKIKFAQGGDGSMHTVDGTRFYTQEGVEITDVVSFSIPTVHVDDILCVTITVPITSIEYPSEG